jgi:hypothetical protein
MDPERSPGIVPDPSIEAAAEMRVRRIETEEPMAEARLAEGGDEELDRSLRPPRLADFVAQEAVTSQLEVFIEAARRRGEPLDHVLLSGPPGLGKTSLAHIVAAELGAGLVHTAAPALERKAPWSQAPSSSSTRSTASTPPSRRRSIPRWRTAACPSSSVRVRALGL